MVYPQNGTRNITLTGVEPILQTRRLQQQTPPQMSNNPPPDYQSVESRRSSRSDRRMTRIRRFYYHIGTPLLRGLIRLLVWSYRYQPTVGAEHIDALIASEAVCAPAYWHQHHVLCSTEVRRWIGRGFKACFLISGSVDGEVPERIARAWGAEVIRGSANESGALALRDQHAMMKSGYSIVTTPDGPQGPQHELKTGVMLMARIGGVPIVPVACAADRAWFLNRWDRFMIPKPFSRVAIGIGKPYAIPPGTPVNELEPHRLNVQRAVMSVMEECQATLKQRQEKSLP
jgi:lysophospholipid acyltransferase (LPLAT)-like uncharacterized protein